MMNFLKAKGWRHLAAIPFIAIGVAIVAFAASQRERPEKRPVEERVYPVQTASVQRLSVIPKAIGYGFAEPRRVWSAVAQIPGKLTFLADLREGAFVREGTHLATIDPTDYELNVRQSKARIESIEAQLQTLETDLENTRALLKIEEESKDLAEKELERFDSLRNDQAVSESEYEAKKNALLASNRVVTDLNNQIRRLEAQRNELESQRKLEQVLLESAEADLSRTTIHAPYDGYLADLPVEEQQFVAAGVAILMLDEASVLEIDSQFSKSAFERLRPSHSQNPEVAKIIVNGFVGRNEMNQQWAGSFHRYSPSYDRQTGMLGAIIRVTNPPESGQPLRKGVYTRVEAWGEPISNAMVIPRAAISENTVYTVENDNRLASRNVQVLFTQDDFAVIRDGLSPDDRVVTSQLPYVIDGMKLDPADDVALNERIARQAEDKGQPVEETNVAGGDA